VFEMKSESIVWIYCPRLRVTGGPEALHQLAYMLGRLGLTARMVYYPERRAGYPTPAPYAGYNVTAVPYATPGPDDVVVVSETNIGQLRRIRGARKLIWWLSVDNYVKQRTNLKEFLSRLYHLKPLLSEAAMKTVGSVAQSAYAQDFLRQRGFGDVPIVSDFLSDAVVTRASAPREGAREAIVAYNPAKGFEFTRGLIAAAGDRVRFEPIQGLSPEGVVDLLQRAKLYIDFGNHPGRDRLPREAALAGCCVLVGKSGSAAFAADMPIPAAYKCVPSPAGYEDILVKIEGILRDYEQVTAEFEPYRAWIRAQKNTFHDEVARIFQKP